MPRCLGFNKTGLISSHKIRSFIIKYFPAKHLMPISEIRFVDIYKPTLQDNDKLESALTKGLYYTSTWFAIGPSNEKIEIYRQDPQGCNNIEYMKFCIAHEIGHSVYNNLPEGVQNKWKQISVGINAVKAISIRAQKNLFEDFSENYASYYMKQKEFHDKYPNKVSFFDSL